jgi:hypothetical protein
MTFDSDNLSVEVLDLRNGKQKSVSIKQRVYALLDTFPSLTAKPLCRKLGLPYPNYGNYVGVLRSEWKSEERHIKTRGSVLNAKLVATPKIKAVVTRSCRNCGWKLDKPIVVELYGIRRVDHKTLVNKHKWCVVRSERPPKGCCSEWIPKQKNVE